MTDRITGAATTPERAAGREDAARPSAEHERLARLATEFESSLMLQMLREMRRAAVWNDEKPEAGGESEALFEMLDSEFALQMTRAQGLGLGAQLTQALDRMRSGRTPADAAGPAAPEVPEHVTSGYGWRRDPFSGETTFHRGIDIRAAYGDNVSAVAAGRVVSAGEAGSYGTAIVLEHANGTRTRYAHLSAALVRAGEDVGAGQLIGRAGSSGRATGPHLHFELLDRNGVPLDPRPGLK
jgi:murein DD-endopeptidase MepM/ murein hydrolase activator NlpD